MSQNCLSVKERLQSVKRLRSEFFVYAKGTFLIARVAPLIVSTIKKREYNDIFSYVLCLTRKYKLESIMRVEKKEDPEKGSRYFLELQVGDLQTGSSHILAEYVYRPLEANATLCYPKGMQWNRTADVYLIVTSKNLGRWVHHFIENAEQIVRETKDPHLHVVIFDFESPDIDLKEAFKQSSLTNYHFITQPGKYSRGLSFSEAIKSITDPNAIVVMMDLHLDIGSRFISDTRKVT